MQYIGEISALGAALLWSFSSFVFTEATKRISTYQLNLNRLFFAWIFLAITILIAGLNYKIALAPLALFVLSGLIGLTLGDWFLFKSFKEIGPRISMLIMALNPAIAAVIAYFFLNERLSFLGVLGIIITLSGISLVVLEKHDDEKVKFKITKIGVIFGVLAAFGQGVGLIFSKAAFNYGYVNGFVATFFRIFSAYFFLIGIGYLTKRHENPFGILRKDKKALFYVILGSLIGPYFGMGLSLISIMYTEVGVSATLMSTSPILILPLSRLIYKEHLTWRSVGGAFVAVAGIIMLFLN